MLSSAARLGAKYIGGRLANPKVFGKNSGARFGTRSYASATETDGNVTKPKSTWGRKLLGAVAAIAVGAYVGDMALNDDMDNLTDKFRTRLSEEERTHRPKVVILGSGWGAMSMLRKLQTDKFNVTVVSPRNFFLFTPLLASTTSGLLEVRSIMEPIRKFCFRNGRQETRFVEMAATSVDPVNQKVYCQDTSAIKGLTSQIAIDYDYLVVGVGAETATFGIPGVQENAIYMKSIQDSRRIRDSVMDCFETAMIPGQPQEEIDRLLHFVVAGGGPAGVEYTAELYDFITRDLTKSFPEVADRVKISLVEALPKILPMFDSKLIEYTEQKLNATRRVEVWTKRAVTKVDPTTITIKNMDSGEFQSVPYGTLVWVTGNSPVSLTKDLLAKIGPAAQPVPRGLSVDEHLRVKGAKNIFAFGDCALAGRLPPTAQVASQEGRFLGRLLNSFADELHAETQALRGVPVAERPASEVLNKNLNDSNKFIFHYLGTMAYIGDNEAIADFGPDSGKHAGFSTWLLWRSVYMSKLLSVRNRVFVASDWLRAAIFGRDISRG